MNKKFDFNKKCFMRLVKPFARVPFVFEPKAQSDSIHSQTKFSFAHSYGFTRLVKPFARVPFVFEPKAQPDSIHSQTKFRFAHSYGFTLAEVLITLTILGVVSVIVIPNMVKGYQKKVLVTQLQRWYADMSNTVNEYKAISGKFTVVGANATADEEWASCWKNENAFLRYLDEKYGNLYKNCKSSDDSKKIGQSLWKNKSGEIYYTNFDPTNDNANTHTPFHNGGSIYQSKSYGFKSGAAMALHYRNDFGYHNWFIVVDVNGGKKGPNVIGRDVFYFYINDETGSSAKRSADGIPGELYTRFEMDPNGLQRYWFVDGHNVLAGDYNNSCNPQKNVGYACSEKILKEHWKMNY